MSAFLSFDKLITPSVIKVVYWIGIAVIIIFGIVGAIAGLKESALAPLGAIIGVIVGLFVWRVYCELIMLWFKIHDELAGIRQNTAK
jgi:hypothetical protein